jgi:hypothetical protein
MTVGGDACDYGSDGGQGDEAFGEAMAVHGDRDQVFAPGDKGQQAKVAEPAKKEHEDRPEQDCVGAPGAVALWLAGLNPVRWLGRWQHGGRCHNTFLDACRTKGCAQQTQVE